MYVGLLLALFICPRAGKGNRGWGNRYTLPISRISCLTVWGGADVIIIDIKCAINVVCLNHPEIIPLPGPWEHCPPQQWSLVPEWLGTAVSHMPHVDGVTVSAGLSQGVTTQVPPSSEPEAGAGVQKVCLGSTPPWSRGTVEGGKSSVIKVTANMFVGKQQKQKLTLVNGNPFPWGILRRDRQPINCLPGGWKGGMCAHQLLSCNTRHGRGVPSLALGCPGTAVVQTACAGRNHTQSWGGHARVTWTPGRPGVHQVCEPEHKHALLHNP